MWDAPVTTSLKATTNTHASSALFSDPYAATRDIMDAGARHFARRGYVATTLDAIAADIGATKGRIYYHFANKAALYFAVQYDGGNRVMGQAEQALWGSGTGAERLQKMLEGHTQLLMEHLDYATVSVQMFLPGAPQFTEAEQTPESGPTLPMVREQQRIYLRLYQRVIAEGRRDGSLVDSSGDMTAKVLLSAVNAVVLWYRPEIVESAQEREELAVSLVARFLHGVLPR